MKSLRVTYGGWVSLEATLTLDDAEHDRLRACLEHDDPAQRILARDTLRLRLQRTHPLQAIPLPFADCEIEALDFELPAPRRATREPLDQPAPPPRRLAI